MKCKKQKWDEHVVGDGRFDPAAEVIVRSIADVKTEAKVLVDDILFEGLDFLRCYEGRFRLSFRDHEPIELTENEVLVVYPGRFVTIEALEKSNRLVYGIFGGRDVVSFFDALGCFDFLKGKTVAHLGSIMQLRQLVEAPDAGQKSKRTAWMSCLADIVTSQVQELRSNTVPLLFDAVRQIQRNVRKGIVRLEPLCEQLKVSRVYLHRLFVAAGLGSPSEYIRDLQLRNALQLLSATKLEIAAIAKRSGFGTAAHFSTVIRRHTGLTPTQFRLSRKSAG